MSLQQSSNFHDPTSRVLSDIFVWKFFIRIFAITLFQEHEINSFEQKSWTQKLKANPAKYWSPQVSKAVIKTKIVNTQRLKTFFSR